MDPRQILIPGWDGALDSHYLGVDGARGRLTFRDEHGIIVFAGPTSRMLPQDWLELSRWCIRPGGSGSRQWAACLRWLLEASDASTVVSYSDPGVGHTGALYRACNWVWAPTWHVLREPPTGGGLRGGRPHRAKHRWVYLLRADARREEALRLKDASLERRFPWVSYREPKWRRGKPRLTALASRYRLWAQRA